jgi:FemAB-related protein (PEP-CTERM system-associated)
MTADGGALHVEEYTGPGADWDAFVRSAEGATFCHLWGWREVMEQVLGHRAHYRVARDGGERLVGVLPLVQVRSRIFGHYVLSMPFLNDGGPLGESAAREALAQDARTLASTLGADLLELRMREPLGSLEPLGSQMRVSHRKITVMLDLPQDSDALWKQLDGKLRSQVRRPMKEGMTHAFGPAEVEPFYEVFAHNMRDLGTPVLPFALFDALRRVFPETVVFGTVRHLGRTVAGGCGFLFRNEFEITWASSLREYSRMAPNMLLYWAFLEETTRRGARVFNFGRCTPGGGTHRFKLQWGGHDVPLPWTQWSPSGTTATPSPDRPLFRLATQAWSRLPLAVANRLGPVLSRQLP